MIKIRVEINEMQIKKYKKKWKRSMKPRGVSLKRQTELINL